MLELARAQDQRTFARTKIRIAKDRAEIRPQLAGHTQAAKIRLEYGVLCDAVAAHVRHNARIELRVSVEGKLTFQERRKKDFAPKERADFLPPFLGKPIRETGKVDRLYGWDQLAEGLAKIRECISCRNLIIDDDKRARRRQQTAFIVAAQGIQQMFRSMAMIFTK